MTEPITKEQVADAFAEASTCMGAANCKRLGEAMCAFYRLDNQHTVETGEGRITFASAPVGPCPNQDQLFCQDISGE